jgi:hypothetical protein
VSQKILAIGIDVEHEGIDTALFQSQTSLADCDVAVVDPRAATALWDGLGSGAEAGLARNLVDLVRRRRQEASDLLVGSGGTLVCLLRPIGTPLRLRHRRRDGSVAASALHAYSWLPPEAGVSRLVISANRGQKLIAADEDHFAWALIHAQGQAARAEACVANDTLPDDWHVIAANELGHPVAFETQVGTGRLVFVPPIAADDAAQRGDYLAFALAPPPEEPETAAPHWLAAYPLPHQNELAQRKVQLAQEVERLQGELDDVAARLAERLVLSRLLYARSPRELSRPVAAALRLLGCHVEPVGKAGDCLDVRSPEGHALAVLATCDDAIDSDPYWYITRLLGEREDPPKGLIIGNAACTTAPSERGAPFTDLLRRGAHHKRLALVSAVDLHIIMGALYRRPEDDDLRQKVRQALFTTDGLCPLTPLLDEE